MLELLSKPIRTNTPTPDISLHCFQFLER